MNFNLNIGLLDLAAIAIAVILLFAKLDGWG
jgi:hypothetical protein